MKGEGAIRRLLLAARSLLTSWSNLNLRFRGDDYEGRCGYEITYGEDAVECPM